MRSLPTSLRLTVVLLLAEALGVGVVAGVFAYDGFTQPVATVGGAVTVVVFPVILAGALGLLGVALARCRAWARGPAVALELLLVPLGYAMLSGGAPWLGLPAIVAGLVCTALLLMPATRAALGIR